jgi:hypothetical protein
MVVEVQCCGVDTYGTWYNVNGCTAFSGSTQDMHEASTITAVPLPVRSHQDLQCLDSVSRPHLGRLSSLSRFVLISQMNVILHLTS